MFFRFIYVYLCGMKTLVVPIDTVKGKVYRQYLEAAKVFPPFNELRPKELDVLAELYLYNDKYQNVELTDRWKLIMHYDTKMQIKDKLGLSDANFNNILSSLKKRKLLIEKKIPNNYLFTIEGKEFDFTIKFKIAD